MTQVRRFRFTRNNKVRRAMVGALLFIFIAATFMAVSPFSAKAAPAISMGGWKDGQTKIVVKFDDGVNDGAGGPLVASDFVLAGINVGVLSISSVEHNPGSEIAIITLSGVLNSAGGTDLTITCAASSVFNMANQPCTSSAVNVYTSVAEDTVGPVVQELIPVGGTSVFVMFNEALDTSTAVSGNFTLTTADGGDDSSITTVNAFVEGVQIDASAAVLATGSGNTLAVGTSVTDVFGNASGGETVTILPSIKISEVQVASASNTKQEYIELYNVSPESIDLTGLKLHFWNGSTDTNVTLTMFNTIIPANGFYLIAPSSYTSGNGATPDATYTATGAIQLTTNGAVYVSDSATADTSVIDLLGWGTSTKKEGTVIAAPSAGESLERKSGIGSTAATMTGAGNYVFSGNGEDSGNNLLDFVVQTPPVPQDSFFAPEFPFGAEFNSGGDTVAPTVTDSFPSASTASFIPANLATAGVDFSEQIIPNTANTTTVFLAADSAPGTNLCQSVTYDPAAQFGAAVTCTINPAALPLAAAPHTFTVSTGVTDLSANGLASDYTVAFTPSATMSFASTAAPEMVGSSPSRNSTSFPPNGNFISVNFNQSLLAASLTGNVTLQNTTQSTTETITGLSLITVVDTDDAILLDVSGVTFTAGDSYQVTVTTGVTSSDGVPIAATELIPFTVASTNDTTGPTVVVTAPAHTETGVGVGETIIHVSMNEALDPSSVSNASVKLMQGTDILASTVSYNSGWKEIEIVADAAFDPSTAYKIRLGAAGSPSEIKNVAGIALQDTDGDVNGGSSGFYIFSFTTGSADVTAPTASFASMTQNRADFTFTESMRSSTVTNLANWALESPVGTSIPLTAMSGNTVSWDPATFTATLGGVDTTAGNSFQLTASTAIKDIAGNALATPAVMGGTVMDAGIFGANNGPAAGFTGDTWDMPAGFSTNDFGFVPQASAWPTSGMAGKASNYMIDFPISEQIRSSANGGKVVVTFPTGFGVGSATALASNIDANGPGTGTVAINSVTANATARTVTVDFSIATRCGSGNVDPCVTGDEQDFMHIELSGIVNTTVPRDWETAGYSVDIKTMTGGTLLETMTSMPFFIGAPGTHSLTVDLTAGASATGTETVHIWSPTTGELTAVANWATDGDGTAAATFSSLPEDYYDVWTESSLNIVGTEDFNGLARESVWVSGSITSSKTLLATSGLQTVTINITGATGKNIDVFAGGPSGFKVKQIASTTGSDTVTMKLADGEWNFGVGPHMDMENAGGMGEAPDYIVTPNWLPVNVAFGGSPAVSETSDGLNDGTINFALASAAFTVPVSVTDSNGKPIVDAMVVMDDTVNGFGTFGKTSASGIANLQVNAGSFGVNAMMMGVPPTGGVKVKVDASGNIFIKGSTTAVSTIPIKLSKGSTVISGTVTDGTNPVAGAGVHAFCTANCNGYQDAGSMSGASGSYTLYVGNGTWNVEAYIPGHGPTPQTTVIVSGANQTGINIAPSSTATFRTISGTVCKKAGGGASCSSGTGLGGIEVFAYSNAVGGGSNSTQTASDGTYSLRVQGADGYTVEAWDKRAGQLPALTSVDTSSGNATSKDIVIEIPKGVAINIEDGVGTPVVLQDVFIEFFDDTTNIRQHMSIKNASSGTINLPDGAYDVFVHSMSAPITPATDVLAVNGGTDVTLGVLTVNGAENIKIVVPALNTVSGQLTDGSTAVADAWVEVSDPASGIFMGTSTDSSGNYSISVPSGSYQMNAFSPGLILDAVSLTVAGSVTKNLVGSVTSSTISGTVRDTSGNTVPYAFVRGIKDGGGSVATQANADGEYDLSVDDGDWSVTGNGYGFQPKTLASKVEISGNSVASTDVQFTALQTGLKDPKVTTITPSAGGMATDSTLGLSVTVPGGATSSSTSAGSLSMKETNNVVSTATTNIVGNGFEVSMSDNSGTALTSGFTEDVTITRTMTVAELSTAGVTTSGEVDKMTVSYINGNGTLVPETTITTYLDASGDVVAAPAADLSNVTDVRFKTAVNHFTVFAITAPADGVAPAVPTGVSATSGSSSITVSWSAVTTNADASAISDLAGYEIYRDTSAVGSFTTQLNSSDILTTSYTDSTAVVGTNYYYKVTAADTGGLESTKSSAVLEQVSSSASSGGGSGQGTTGGGAGALPTTTNTTVDTPISVNTEEDVALGITRDNEGRRVSTLTDTTGPSPITGAMESISSVVSGQFVRSYSFDTVYYVDADMNRRPFWDAKSFMTWGDDWDSVVWVTDATLSTMAMKQPMLPQPGRVLVKVQSDPKVYAIETDPGDTSKDRLRWIPSEAVASEIYGANWSDYIVDLEPTVIVRYSMGTELSSGASVDTSGIMTRMSISGR